VEAEKLSVKQEISLREPERRYEMESLLEKHTRRTQRSSDGTQHCEAPLHTHNAITSQPEAAF
jgi:hypothetical protein